MHIKRNIDELMARSNVPVRNLLYIRARVNTLELSRVCTHHYSSVWIKKTEYRPLCVWAKQIQTQPPWRISLRSFRPAQ